jgi:hypothetical protein
MYLPPFLTQDADGEIHLTGRRIGLYTVLRDYQQQRRAEPFAEEYKLPLALVYGVLALYLENEAEVDVYVTACGTELDRLEAKPPGSGVQKVRSLGDGQRPPEAP